MNQILESGRGREMEGVAMAASIWGYEESMDELKHNLLAAKFELESTKAAAKEEMIKNQEIVKYLIQVLKKVSRERDEAIQELEKLLKSLPSTTIQISTPLQPDFQPQILPSEIPEININTSETKPENLSSKISRYDEQILKNQTRMNDYALMVIDNIVMGKPLPRHGRFLQAIIEAGPLLQTLLIAGPIPRWRNPPSNPALLASTSSAKNEAEIDIVNKKGCSYFDVFQGSSSKLSSPSVLNFERGSAS